MPHIAQSERDTILHKDCTTYFAGLSIQVKIMHWVSFNYNGVSYTISICKIFCEVLRLGAICCVYTWPSQDRCESYAWLCSGVLVGTALTPLHIIWCDSCGLNESGSMGFLTPWQTDDAFGATMTSNIWFMSSLDHRCNCSNTGPVSAEPGAGLVQVIV